MIKDIIQKSNSYGQPRNSDSYHSRSTSSKRQHSDESYPDRRMDSNLKESDNKRFNPFNVNIEKTAEPVSVLSILNLTVVEQHTVTR